MSYLKVVAGSVKTVFPLFGGASTVATSLSLALIGVGHLVGLGVGIAMIVGLLISYEVLLPVRCHGDWNLFYGKFKIKKL